MGLATLPHKNSQTIAQNRDIDNRLPISSPYDTSSQDRFLTPEYKREDYCFAYQKCEIKITLTVLLYKHCSGVVVNKFCPPKFN